MAAGSERAGGASVFGLALLLAGGMLLMPSEGWTFTLLPVPGPITCHYGNSTGICVGALDVRNLTGDAAAFLRTGGGELFVATVDGQAYSCAPKKGSVKKLWDVALSNSRISFRIQWTGSQTVGAGPHGTFAGAECTDLVLANWTHDGVVLEVLVGILRVLASAQEAYFSTFGSYGSEAQLAGAGLFQEPVGVSVDIVLGGGGYTATARQTLAPGPSCSTSSNGSISCP